MGNQSFVRRNAVSFVLLLFVALPWCYLMYFHLRRFWLPSATDRFMKSWTEYFFGDDMDISDSYYTRDTDGDGRPDYEDPPVILGFFPCCFIVFWFFMVGKTLYQYYSGQFDTSHLHIRYQKTED